MKTVTRGLLAASMLFGSAQPTAAQSADDIIERHLAALDGRAALVARAKSDSPVRLPVDDGTLPPVKSLSLAEAPQVEDRAPRDTRPLNASQIAPTIIMISMFGGAGLIITALLALWFRHRSRVKALEVLRVYAERSEEPPASVTEALTGPHFPQAPPKPPPTRGQHLAHVAANVVFVLGAIGIVWWKAPDPGNPGGLVVFTIFAGLFFAAAAAARLVGAIYARDDR